MKGALVMSVWSRHFGSQCVVCKRVVKPGERYHRNGKHGEICAGRKYAELIHEACMREAGA